MVASPRVLMPLGLIELSYDKMAAFAHNPLGKLMLFGAVAFPAWHAGHHWSPVARVVASQIARSISSSEKNHGLRFEGNPQNRFARKSPSKGQKPANSVT
jgi:hypothetical protein